MRYILQEDQEGFCPYGGAAKAFYSRAQEVVLAGPAETGKTFSFLWKIHLFSLAYSGLQSAIVRKTYKSAIGSVLQTYWNKVIGGEGKGVHRFGKERPERFIYPNGSTVWCGGMDNPDKVLSSERDLIFYNQLEEENDESNWEYLLTRCTGRAGNLPWGGQLLGDCNPGPPHLWIRHRSPIEFYESRHRENPVLYDQLTGAITAQGKRTMGTLNRLTGIRRDRLLLGKWVQAEGLIYETWDDAVHLINKSEAPVRYKRYSASVDWGFTGAGVIGVWGIDEDGRMYLVHQVVRTKKLSEWWVEKAVELNAKYGIDEFVCDPARPEYIAAFNNARNKSALVDRYGSLAVARKEDEYGIRLRGDVREDVKQSAARLTAIKGNNSVGPGIDAVSARLKVQADGKPRLFIVRDSLEEIDPGLRAAKLPCSTEQEVLGYAWNPKKADEPVDKNNHGLDMARYMVAHEDDLWDEQLPDPAGEIVEAEKEDRGTLLAGRGRSLFRGHSETRRRRGGR